MKRGFSYLFYAALLWMTALSVNYFSYAISDQAVALRETITLSFDRADLPVSSIKDTDVNVVSFNQRALNDDKKNLNGQAALATDGHLIWVAQVYHSAYTSHSAHLYQLPPFDFLTHQFLI